MFITSLVLAFNAYFYCIQAFQDYLNVAKQMKAYENQKYNQWVDKSVRFVATTYMKENVIKLVPLEKELGEL